MALRKFENTTIGEVYVNPDYVVALIPVGDIAKTHIVLAAQGPSRDGGATAGAFKIEVKLAIADVAEMLK